MALRIARVQQGEHRVDIKGWWAKDQSPLRRPKAGEDADFAASIAIQASDSRLEVTGNIEVLVGEINIGARALQDVGGCAMNERPKFVANQERHSGRKEERANHIGEAGAYPWPQDDCG